MSESGSFEKGSTPLDRIQNSLDRMHRDMGDMREAIGALTAKIERHDNCHIELQALRQQQQVDKKELEEKILQRERAENTEKMSHKDALAALTLAHSTEITTLKTKVTLYAVAASGIMGAASVVVIEIVKALMSVH